MTGEKLQQALVLHQTIECLTEAKHRIEVTEKEKKLAYMVHDEERGYWYPADMSTMKYIGDILDRHDGMIREEIDKRIAQYKQELENL